LRSYGGSAISNVPTRQVTCIYGLEAQRFLWIDRSSRVAWVALWQVNHTCTVWMIELCMFIDKTKFISVGAFFTRLLQYCIRFVKQGGKTPNDLNFN
jgi:hypothetical protein